MLELSCHQLEHLKVSPHIAVLLNLYEEHLDHYGTMEKYVRAKQNIYAWQTRGRHPVLQRGRDAGAGDRGRGRGERLRALPLGDHLRRPCAGGAESHGRGGHRGWPDGGGPLPGQRPSDPGGEGISLFGAPQRILISAVVYGICKEFSMTDEKFLRALRTFQTLPHRLQYLGTKSGLRFYDDSISTIGGDGRAGAGERQERGQHPHRRHGPGGGLQPVGSIPDGQAACATSS